MKWQLISLLATFIFCFTTPLFALATNSVAPNFTLANLEGEKVSLSDYRGKMVILKLGTTWCPGCRDQSRELQKIDGFMEDAGIIVIEVFLDEPIKAVKTYQQQHIMRSTVVTLLGDERIKRDYGIHAIPRLIILSAQQKILTDSNGMMAPQIKVQILQSNK